VHTLLLPVPLQVQVLPEGIPEQLHDDDPEQNACGVASVTSSLSQQPL
jgi:hypothetical protein